MSDVPAKTGSRQTDSAHTSSIDAQAIDWLLTGDPAVAWQAMDALTDASPDAVAARRAEVATTGWGKALLERQVGGQWADGACFPNRNWRPRVPISGDPDGQPWTATYPTLRVLRSFGVDPKDPHVAAAVDSAAASSRWEYNDSPLFDGEVEPCINGGTVTLGAYFGHDIEAIVTRLLGEQLADGGWNCEAERGSTRSSFHTTINVLEALLEYERAGGSQPVVGARRVGEEYLLERHLMRRASTGQVIDPRWLRLSFPTHWHYDVLRGLDYFRAVGGTPDPRLAEAVDLVRSKQTEDGKWLQENTHPGLIWFELEDGDGSPSRWNTLRALRSLRWYDAPDAG